VRVLAPTAALVGAFVLAACGGAREGSTPADAFTLGEARRFSEFPLYYAGEAVDGLPLVAVTRRSDTADYVSVVYGDCVSGDDAGCAPPAEIQVWPACWRNLGLYGASVPALAGSTLERSTIRGVPAVILDGGTRIELQTGRSVVVLFASTPARAARLASALQPVGSQSAAGALPLPSPGALDGTLAC
jgi:hypothetical protein